MADIMGARKVERLFHESVRLDVDKTDLRRLIDFLHTRMTDMMIIGQANAKANGRDIIEPQDLPIGKGLQQNIDEFEGIDVDLEVGPILEHLADVPDLHMTFSEETQRRLPNVLGGLTVSLGKVVKASDPEVKNPQTEHWDRAQTVFDALI